MSLRGLCPFAFSHLTWDSVDSLIVSSVSFLALTLTLIRSLIPDLFGLALSSSAPVCFYALSV